MTLAKMLMAGTALGLFFTLLAVAVATGDGWIWAGAVTAGMITFAAVIVLLADSTRKS